LQLYLDKTSESGIVVLHLSNRNLALVSEAARVADSIGAAHVWRVSGRVRVPLAPVYGGLGASVMIVAKSPDDIARLAFPREPVAEEGAFKFYKGDRWVTIPAPPGRAWSDDYINLPRSLWDNFSGAERCVTRPGLTECRNEER
jgi:hypothetical protein